MKMRSRPHSFNVRSSKNPSLAQTGDINRINDADWLTESITALTYQRHEGAFACHMEDIPFQTAAGPVWEEGGQFRVARPCHH